MANFLSADFNRRRDNFARSSRFSLKLVTELSAEVNDNERFSANDHRFQKLRALFDT
ncbi:MAG: hypothetical protein N3B10_01240 [Armatimonadetes bacterium]|nr:hypothetical protein [Armatimonadota bacterium]MCX7967093.1 hypothetical protein [Armatimonadota bacterium]MDW8142722.1 hypothetical protein [Armatimonadota bacterium]